MTAHPWAPHTPAQLSTNRDAVSEAPGHRFILGRPLAHFLLFHIFHCALQLRPTGGKRTSRTRDCTHDGGRIRTCSVCIFRTRNYISHTKRSNRVDRRGRLAVDLVYQRTCCGLQRQLETLCTPLYWCVTLRFEVTLLVRAGLMDMRASNNRTGGEVHSFEQQHH